MTLIDGIKKIMNKGEEEPEEELEPIRDKHLEHLEREWEFHAMQERKEELKHLLAEKKKQLLRDGLFGRYQEQKQYLGEEHKKKKVCVMGGTNILKQKKILNEKNLLKQKSMFGRQSLLNNKKREFKKVKVL